MLTLNCCLFFSFIKKNFNHLILGIDNKNLSITDLSFF
ncbi:hypothetical protein BSPLISOX_3161 [uncultured Gammaproteobacteria bacterium]|nr:hypothetical protein BSPLISOX_3161 [uncultured Gammaproteobacteria bacterium]